MSLFGIASILCKPLIGILSDWIGGRHKALLILLLGLFGPILIAFGANERAPGLSSGGPARHRLLYLQPDHEHRRR